MVRKCVEKATGKEYAVKIVEFSGPELQEATKREIEIMKLVGGHSNISNICSFLIQLFPLQFNEI